MFKCPNCDAEIESKWERECDSCKTQLVHCQNCNSYSTLRWESLADSPSRAVRCIQCSEIVGDTVYICKSDIYNHYNFAFKFVNRVHVAYPFYFHEGFPFGKIQEDMGHYVNDFIFEDDQDKDWAKYMGTDWGTARGYRINFEIDGNTEECVALSHESGLEIFLIAVGGFVGIEVAKYSLKRILETVEKRINEWYSRGKISSLGLIQEDKKEDKPLIERIAVRTPDWELSIDGRFTAEEKEKIINFIGASLRPQKNIAEYIALMEDEDLKPKIVDATKKIVRRFE